MVDSADAKIKLKNRFSSAILKFKIKDKRLDNMKVTEMAGGNLASMQALADDIRKSKSMELIVGDQIPDSTLAIAASQQNQDLLKFKTHIVVEQISPEVNNTGQVPNIDAYLAPDSVGSVSSILEGDDADYYENSILQSDEIKDPQELVDGDLQNLLGFIKKLPSPDDKQV